VVDRGEPLQLPLLVTLFLSWNGKLILTVW
jgi:hypothetical protein